MKEHIENMALRLTSQGHHRNGLMEVTVASVRAAIELMRAASPKDEATEREHCRKVARDIQTTFDPVGQVERERAGARAAARAENVVDYAALRALFNKLIDLGMVRRNDCDYEQVDAWVNFECALSGHTPADLGAAATESVLREQLSAAQAEIAQWRESQRQNLSELSAEQAEIERLSRDYDSAMRAHDTLEREHERLQCQYRVLAEHDSDGARAFDALEREHERLREAVGHAQLVLRHSQEHDCGAAEAFELLRAALDPTSATPARSAGFTVAETIEGLKRFTNPTPVVKPARQWTCAACGGQCETECGVGRETFDPDAVRELLEMLCEPLPARWEGLRKQVQCVRDSERK